MCRLVQVLHPLGCLPVQRHPMVQRGWRLAPHPHPWPAARPPSPARQLPDARRKWHLAPRPRCSRPPARLLRRSLRRVSRMRSKEAGSRLLRQQLVLRMCPAGSVHTSAVVLEGHETQTQLSTRRTHAAAPAISASSSSSLPYTSSPSAAIPAAGAAQRRHGGPHTTVPPFKTADTADQVYKGALRLVAFAWQGGAAVWMRVTLAPVLILVLILWL